MQKSLTPSTALLPSLPLLLQAGNAVVGRLVSPLVPPMTLNFLRWPGRSTAGCWRSRATRRHCVATGRLFCWRKSCSAWAGRGWPLAAALGHIAIGPAVLAYRCWGMEVARVGPAVAGFFTNLMPLFAGLLLAAFLGELPHAYHPAVFALIVGDIVVSARR